MRNQPSGAKTLGKSELRRSFKRSLIIHSVFIGVLIFKGLVFPEKFELQPPTLRVDIVGLPDILKKDLPNAPKTQGATEAESAPEPKAKKEVEPEETKKEDELVLKPKETKKQAKKDQKDRNKQIHSALSRIKSLEKITGSMDTPKVKTPGVLIKGNQVSHGTSLSGDAKEGESNYLDQLREHLRSNWSLPVWLARQNLSAHARLYLDFHGRLSNFEIVKPSGNAQFDEAIKQTIQNSQPYPVPTAELRNRLITQGVVVGFPL